MMRNRIERALEFWLSATAEVLLGIAVVGLIVGWVPALAWAMPGRRDCTKADRAAGIDLPAIAQGVEAFRAQRGRTPASIDEMVAAGIFTHAPDDPWDRPYLYGLTPHGPKVTTLGKDGLPGGTDGDADLEWWVDARH